MPSPFETSQITTVQGTSGLNDIDALFSAREDLIIPDAFRDETDGLTIAKWGGPQGTGATISFSFLTSDSVFPVDYLTQYSGEVYEITDIMKEAHREAFARWSAVADVEFVEILETPYEVGDIRIGTSVSNTNFGPDDLGGEAIGPAISFNGRSPASHVGDIFYSAGVPELDDSYFSFDGGKFFNVAAHEIGHAALGLIDTSYVEGWNNTQLPTSINFNSYTIMSYSSVPGTSPSNYDPNIPEWLDFYPTTPMMLDIRAVQWFYGANTTHAADDTTYTFLPDQRYYETIWDAGGVDTIDASAIARDLSIDLNPGTLSDIGSEVTAYVVGVESTITETLGIAFETYIENAIGGIGADHLKGNDLANQLTGGEGDDELDGGMGEDTSIYQGLKANYSISVSANAVAQVSDRSGGSGTDQLASIERVQFSDGALEIGLFGSAYELSDEEFSALTEMYLAYFNRAPDAEGLLFWAHHLANDLGLSEIANFFFSSLESQAAFGDGEDISSFLNAIYENVLGRSADVAGFEFWRDAIETGGVTVGTAVLEILNGADGNENDTDYLAQKTELGLHFAITRGMSDTQDAASVMQAFGSQSESNFSAAISEIDQHYQDASAEVGGDMLISIVGLLPEA